MSENHSKDESGDEESERDEESSGEEAESASDEEAASASDEESPSSDRDRPRKHRRSEKSSKRARREEQARLEKKNAMIRTVAAGVVALAVGGAAGWFGHIEKAKATLRAESAPATAGSAAGPCGAWEKQICKSSGEQSAACQQAKGATSLLTPGTCEVALEAVPATLAKVKAERASCDQLIDKLCKDLPPDSKACAMVKERTPSFPPERCKELLGKYDQVLAEVRQIDQNPMPMGMPAHGADDGHGH